MRFEDRDIELRNRGGVRAKRGGAASGRLRRKPMPPVPPPPATVKHRRVAAVDIVPGPRKARRIKIPRPATVGEAFALIGRSGLAHLRANEASVRVARDREGIHQLRVSVRRLRSVLAMFRAMIPDGERRDIGRRLRWISDQCADARELDVFLDELLVPLQKTLPDDPALEDFTAEVEKICCAADVRVADMLAGPQYAANIRRIEAWWNGGDWHARATALAGERASDFSRARISKFHRRLCKLGKRAGELDETGLHDLRIRAKKLRYAIAFFGSLFPKKYVRAYRAALDEIQDCLGALNDTVAARRLLVAVRERAPELDPATFERAADVVAGWNAAKWKAGLRLLPRCWRRFEDLRPFWK